MIRTAAPALLAFDMDGTLLSTSGRPLPGTISAIQAALAQGTVVVLASGRDPWALRLLAERFGLDPARLVFFGLNGTTIVDGASERLLWSEHVAPELLARLLTHVRGFRVTASISVGPDLYVEDADGFNVAVEASANGQQVVVVERLESVPAVTHKVLFCSPPQVLAAEHVAISEPFTTELEFSFSAPTHFECTPRGVTKGMALRYFCDLSGIDLADTVAFGDNENDMEMLRTAGLGVAMGNALESVKEAADLVTANNDSDGIALVLADRFGLA